MLKTDKTHQSTAPEHSTDSRRTPMQPTARTSVPMTAVLLADSGVSLSPRHHQDTWTMVEQQIHFELSPEPALSPSARMMNGSTGSLDMIHASPHHSPHHYSPEPSEAVCSNTNWMMGGMGNEYGHQGYNMGPLHHPYPGDRTPDSGISVYSPGNSPSHSDFEPFEPNTSLPTSLPHLPASTAPTTSCMSDYSTVNTSIAPHHQPMVYPPTSMMPFDHSLPYEMQPSYPAHPHPPALLPTQFNDESMDPIKILAEDRVTGATIQYYNDNQLPPVSVAEFSAQQYTQLADPGFPHHHAFEYPAPQPHAPRGRPTKPRKPKVPTEVDTSEIKDIPASAQLWEFLLKVIKKPKYSYMVSWENQKDGLFRFHDPSAFAALWGRHRNRPSMTYDKVARALRYYYKRDILEQVGGRLTYKFSKRLQKQFMDSDE